MEPTIESLEGSVWPEPDFRTSLVLTAHALRKKPLDDLTPNDLRVAFNENVGADFLKTVVLEVLQKEPAINSLYFEGDLLLAVMSSRQFRDDEVFRTKIIECADRARPEIFSTDTLNEIKRLRG
jgi:hypothetical protein